MRLFGLIGFPLSHSYSKAWFEAMFVKERLVNHTYNLYPLNDISQLPELIKANPELVGLNVTIPFKEKVIPFLDYIEPAAQKTGAVNVIRIERSGDRVVLSGYNTDIFGFEQVIKPYLFSGDEALILGTGGAAKASAFVFTQYGVRFRFVSRKADEPSAISYDQLYKSGFTNLKLIVNATPLGLFPDIDRFPPIPYNQIPPGCIAFDWIYNPEQTMFLKKAKKAGAIIINGADTFHLQAQKSWEIWNGYSGF